jgi:glycosyltransferase involved in cell wall biosynthesis/Mrp family chromosome partitioning ATPase
MPKKSISTCRVNTDSAGKIGDRAIKLGFTNARQIEQLVDAQQVRRKRGEPHLRLGFMMIASGMITESQLITLLVQDLSGFRLTEDSIRVASRVIGAIKSYRTVLCTSTDNAQNTASVASQVALSIALLERRPVLLIDANQDAPEVSSKFNVVESPGLSDVISGVAPIDEAVSPSGIIGLDVMPTGTSGAEFVTQIVSKRGDEALVEIASRYRYVVIIAPPILESTETLILAQRTDASIIVATAGATKRERLRKTRQALEDVGSLPLGVVLARDSTKDRSNRRKLDRNEPIRVVQLIHTMAYGGIETILINWARSLPLVKVIPTIVCFDNGDGSQEAFVEACENAGIDVRTIPWSRLKPIPRAVSALNAIIRDTNAHLVHTHNVYADIVGMIAARMTGAAAVSTVYVWSDFGWKRNLLQKIDQFCLRRFDAVTAQCLQTQKDTIDRGIDASKTRILKSGFDLTPYGPITGGARDAARRKYNVRPDNVVFVNVARLYPEKAQSELLRAFKKIHERYPRTRLWILGTGPLQDKLESEAASLQLDSFVNFQGFVDNIAIWLALADIQVHPSFAEGVPLAVCSGMAASLPIIASDVGGINEVITHNETGILIPSAGAPDFESALVTAMTALLADIEARTTLGFAARKFMENDYSLLSAVQDIDSAYKELLD